MFKTAQKSIKGLSKKYLVIKITLIIILTLYLTFLNLFSGLSSNTGLKNLYKLFTQSTLLTYSQIRNYISVIVILLGGVLISVISSYLSKLRAKEYSIYLIIAGVDRSSISKQIWIENIILFAQITFISFISFVVISYPVNYLFINYAYSENIKDLTFFIQMPALLAFLALSFVMFVTFSMLQISSMKKLSVKELMDASRSNEIKFDSDKIKIKDWIILILSSAALVGTILLFRYMLQNMKISKAFVFLPVFIVVGFIVNNLIFSKFMKILLVTFNNMAKRYDGLKKYSNSLLISKANTLSKLLGSTASVIVVLISGAIILNEFSAGNITQTAPLIYSSNFAKGVKASSSDFNKSEINYKIDGKKMYFEKSQLQKDTSKLDNYYATQLRSQLDKSDFSKINALNWDKKDSYPVSASYQLEQGKVQMPFLISAQLLNMAGYNKDHGAKKVTANNANMVKEEMDKEDAFSKNLKVFIVTKSKYNSVSAKKAKLTFAALKDGKNEQLYKRNLDIKGVSSQYYLKVLINRTFASLKLFIMIIPILGLIVQISILLFKFINSAWDNKHPSLLFYNLGFSKAAISKMYFSETLKIFVLPLIIGIIEAWFVAFKIIPLLVLKVLNLKDVNMNILYSSTVFIVVLFAIIAGLTYIQYRNISLSDLDKAKGEK